MKTLLEVLSLPIRTEPKRVGPAFIVHELYIEGHDGEFSKLQSEEDALYLLTQLCSNVIDLRL